MREGERHIKTCMYFIIIVVNALRRKLIKKKDSNKHTNNALSVCKQPSVQNDVLVSQADRNQVLVHMDEFT
jgi:hypothetical protein